MAASVLLYGIVQVPAFMGFQNSPQVRHTGASKSRGPGLDVPLCPLVLSYCICSACTCGLLRVHTPVCAARSPSFIIVIIITTTCRLPPLAQAALTGSVTCLVSAVLYCIYSVVSPELQRRRIDAARKKRLRMYMVKVGS